MTKFEAAMQAIKDLQAVGMSAQETHDLLEELRDCVGRYDVSHAIKDAVFVCCDWLDEEQQQTDADSEEDARVKWGDEDQPGWEDV